MPIRLSDLLRFTCRHAALIAFGALLLPCTARADGEKPAAAPETQSATATESRTIVSAVSSSMQTAADHVQTAAGQVLQSAQDVTGYALELIGVRYKFGGETPERGLDCSGLVKYVFEHVTGVTLPRSAREQAKIGEKIDLDELQPGDLVFFNTRRFAFSHVGIYLGDNSFIHAPNRHSKVQVTSIEGRYWKQRFNGARRLLGVMPGVISIEAAKSLLNSLPTISEPAAEK